MALLIPPSLQAAMTRIAETALADTMTIYRRDTTADSAGGTTAAWVATYTQVPCHVMPRPRLAIEATVAEAIQGRDRYVVRVAVGIDLRVRDKVTIDRSGDSLHIVGPETARTFECLMAFDAVLLQ